MMMYIHNHNPSFKLDSLANIRTCNERKICNKYDYVKMNHTEKQIGSKQVSRQRHWDLPLHWEMMKCFYLDKPIIVCILFYRIRSTPSTLSPSSPHIWPSKNTELLYILFSFTYTWHHRLRYLLVSIDFPRSY